MNQTTQDIVTRLSKGLNAVDLDKASKLVGELGLYGAARVLGYDISHYDNLLMAGRLAIENQKNSTPKSILEYVDVMKFRLNNTAANFMLKHHKKLQCAMDENSHTDYDHDWFSANTMNTLYSSKLAYGSQGIETPQFIWLRVATQLYHNSPNALEDVIRTMKELSEGWYTPASPTLFNASLRDPQMASCFLLHVGDDLESILGTGIYRAGLISKASGGLGIDVSRVRHSEIRETGWSSGILPMLQLYNSMVRYVDQCFCPETIVYTDNGPKEIQDVSMGDMVLTLDGTMDEVRFSMEHNYDGDVVEIATDSRPAKVSTSHPFWVKRDGTETWIDACQVKAGDSVCFPVPKYIRDVPEYSDVDMFLYGVMIRKAEVQGTDFTLCLSSTHESRIVDLCNKYFLLRNIKYETNTERDDVSFRWSSGDKFLFNTRSILNKEGKKTIHPNFLHLPRYKTLALLSGLVDYRFCTKDQYVISSDYKIAEIAKYLGLRLGFICASIEAHDDFMLTLIEKNGEMELIMDGSETFPKSADNDGVVWSKVLSVSEPKKYKGPIYDLQMTKNHNYATSHGIVHNGGRRKGSATIFLRTHHIDVEDFIDVTRKVGDKYVRAHDINTCLWTSWIFWQRVKEDGPWTVFCPARVPQLNDLYGKEFTKAYEEAEKDTSILPHHKKVIRARALYDRIRDVQRETGMPYMMDGDGCNIKSNHRHMGYIKSSNLCLEIVEYTDEDTIASCNLHSLSLRTYAKQKIVEDDDVHRALCNSVDFQKLGYISGRVVENLNNVIDQNWYPLDKTKAGKTKPGIINKSNKKHRPVGMGVSGFAEMLHILDLPFEDPRVRVLNKMVFACIYWNALAQSVQLGVRDGIYESFHGSPTSQGKLQFDLWKEEFDILGPNAFRKQEDDIPVDPAFWKQKEFLLYNKDGESILDVIKPTWNDLKRCIVKYGLRNSLLTALMPTASTAQIRRNCESVEAHQNNMYSRKVLQFAYPVLNRHLLFDLEAEGLWNDKIVQYIKANNGSVKGLHQYITSDTKNFPHYSGNSERVRHIEKKYKTMWEIPQRLFLQLAAERGRYIDQSASTNIFIRDCTDEKLSASHLCASMLGLKTLMYYLRQKGGETIKFTADPDMVKYIQGAEAEIATEETRKIVCTDEVCTSCT